jgi:acetyltransferase
MAFVAVQRNETGENEIGVARYISNPDGTSCEFAIVVDDTYQRRGLGRIMMQRLIAVARARGLTMMTGYIVTDNDGMLKLCSGLGFTIHHDRDDAGTRHATLQL